MSESHPSSQSGRVYRVDKFVVPPQARDEFIGKVRSIHELLRTMPGFLQDFVLEQSGGPGEFNFVTLVEWQGPEFVEPAKAVVMAEHRKTGFNPQELFARLGIRADIANYQRVGAG